MKIIPCCLLVWLILAVLPSVKAQQLLPEIEFFSKEKPGFISLPPSGFGRGMSGLQAGSSVLKASKTDLNEVKRDLILFYYEYLDDQQRDVMLQLLNPGFSEKIRIYHDPAAGTTAGIGSIGGIRLTGGVDKGYYVRSGQKTFRLRKGEYEKRFDELFGSCPAVRQNYPSTAWRDFPNHVYYYEKNCP